VVWLDRNTYMTTSHEPGAEPIYIELHKLVSQMGKYRYCKAIVCAYIEEDGTETVLIHDGGGNLKHLVMVRDAAWEKIEDHLRREKVS
jgi:hypothetical protein